MKYDPAGNFETVAIHTSTAADRFGAIKLFARRLFFAIAFVFVLTFEVVDCLVIALVAFDTTGFFLTTIFLVADFTANLDLPLTVFFVSFTAFFDAVFATAFFRGFLTFTSSTTSSSSSQTFPPISLHELDTRAVQGDINIVPLFVIYKTPIHEDVMLVGVQFKIQSLLPEFLTRADVLQVGDIILEDDIAFKRQAQCLQPEISAQVASALSR